MHTNRRGKNRVGPTTQYLKISQRDGRHELFTNGFTGGFCSRGNSFWFFSRVIALRNQTKWFLSLCSRWPLFMSRRRGAICSRIPFRLLECGQKCQYSPLETCQRTGTGERKPP